jgi:hypothetical protein
MLVGAGVAIIVLGPGDKEEPIGAGFSIDLAAVEIITPRPSRMDVPPTRVRVPSPTPTSPSAPSAPPPTGPCTRATYKVVGDSPIGHTYHSGDELFITLAYETDGCTYFGGSFEGYHSADTRRYEYYCSEGCGSRLLSLFITIPQQPIRAQVGTITLLANPGLFPPTSSQSPPDLDGFTLCAIPITFGDGEFGGTAIQSVLGDRCSATPAPIR